ncbi:MAG TPA: hypothetical protein EYP04_03650, partial [Anaerolineae bacterium]|nr:hypothetical protein [Anaerolineae bacterium]
MGVFMDGRIYLALALACVAVGLGIGVALWRVVRRQHRLLSPEQRIALGLLALSGLGTLAGYLGYNVSFVQHQGRYLFPALVPLSLLWAVGQIQALRPTVSRRLTMVFSPFGAGVVAAGPEGWRREQVAVGYPVGLHTGLWGTFVPAAAIRSIGACIPLSGAVRTGHLRAVRLCRAVSVEWLESI